MNPIEEMMEKYGVDKVPVCESFNCVYCSLYDNNKMRCRKGKKFPPFTPEKQLEIIKLISQYTPFGLELEEKHKHTIFTINTDFGSIGHFTFEKALADFLTNIFYYCSTEAQIQQIKEILEG